jgi:hypothetical protein
VWTLGRVAAALGILIKYQIPKYNLTMMLQNMSLYPVSPTGDVDTEMLFEYG